MRELNSFDRSESMHPDSFIITKKNNNDELRQHINIIKSLVIFMINIFNKCFTHFHPIQK